MYGLAVLAFGGLVTAMAVRLLSSYGREMAKTSNVVLWFGLGVGFAYLADYSIFSTWGIDVRSHTVGAVMTGFMVGGMAWLWEEALDFFHHYGHAERSSSKRLSRAA